MTDAREAPLRQPQRPTIGQRQSTRLITVDNVLQYASDIPSAQVRVPSGQGGQRPVHHTRTPSGRHPLDPKLSGRLVPAHMPARSSKLSEKLVLLPETAEVDGDTLAYDGGEGHAPPTDEKVQKMRGAGVLQDKSYAERLPKQQRTEKLARVTAYCTAQAYRMRATAEFVRDQHGAKTKLYDDCLYTVYHLPLLGGSDGFRVRSSPVLKSPGGKAVLDEAIERNERYEYHEGYFGDHEQYGIPANESPGRSPGRENGNGHDEARRDSIRSTSPPRIPTDALSFAEMFVFSYGVVVFWNFTERQEKDILADLTFSATSLATRPQSEDDFETEEFHFEYNPEIPRPRVFNDMITLKSGDHMIKLAMSHAIAQSTKLSFFEERMAATMIEAQYVPRRLALEGKLGMKREEVVKILGRLFRSRVDVNLCKTSHFQPAMTISESQLTCA